MNIHYVVNLGLIQELKACYEAKEIRQTIGNSLIQYQKTSKSLLQGFKLSPLRNGIVTMELFFHSFNSM